MAAPDKPSYRERIGYHTALLGLFTLLASFALMMSYLGTKDEIAIRQQEDLRATLSKIIPARLHDNDMSADVITLPASELVGSVDPVSIFLARNQHKVVAMAYQVTAPDGYAGPIVIMMGVNLNGEIVGVRIISHAETPGLGDKIEIKKSSWALGFDGLSLQNTKDKEWAVKKDGGKFDQFTGATITPRAVVKAVRRGLEFFAKNKRTILDKSAQVKAS